jgi:uncharacterized protein (TIGR02466 family)
MTITPTYSTPIGTYELENTEAMNKGLCEFIYSIRASEEGTNQQYSMGGPHGYHTKEDLLSRNNVFMKQFHELVSEQIVAYYSSITDEEIGPNTKMVSWGMIYGPGDYSKPHVHPLADIATSYYCKVPKGLLKEGEGTFHHIDPRPAAKWDTNFTDTSINSITPKEGTGAIFPGWLEHYVTPHFLEEDRICISTNVFIDHGTFFK